MKKLAVFIMAILIASSLTGCVKKENNNGNTQGKIEWLSYEEGMKIANETGKPVLLYFYKNNKNDSIFSSSDISQKAKDFVMVEINMSKNQSKEIANRYNITDTPSIVIIKGDKEISIKSMDKDIIIYRMDEVDPEKTRVLWLDYSSGMKIYRETGKPILLYICSDSNICKNTDKTIFSNRSVIEKSRKFIMIKINMSKNQSKEIANRYNITDTPSIVIIKGDKEISIKSMDKDIIIYRMDEVDPEKTRVLWLDYSSGMKIYRETGKPILLYICSDSNICKNTDKTIFSNRSVIEKSRKFIMIKINTKKINENLVSLYRLRYIPYVPTIIFIYNDIILHRMIAFDVINPNNKKQSIHNFIENMDRALKGKIWGHDFSFVTLTGKTKHLKDYRGKVVLVDLMATWCQPCRMQMAELKKVLSYYGNSKIAIISIDVEKGDTPQKIRRTFSDHINEWTFGMDKYDIANKYLLQGSIPTLVIFDKYGRLQYLRPGLTQSQNLIGIIDEIM